MEKKSKLPKERKGFVCVGAWVNPPGLIGASFSKYIEEEEERAITNAEEDERSLFFADKDSLYLCEVIIKPIRKIKVGAKTVLS